MAVPSSQVAASWIKTHISSSDWEPLFKICVHAITQKWTGKSEEEILDYIEANINHIANHLRDEASAWLVDGTAPRFHIDNEQPPYVKATELRVSSLLNVIRKIDPFKVEDICALLLQKFGATAYVTQKTGDGGVDFVATNLNIVPSAFMIPARSKATIIGQTKRYKDGNIINEKQLREFVGAALLKKHILQIEEKLSPLTPVLFAFWTTSDFEPNAKIYARDVGLWFMDGHTFATYLQQMELSDYITAMYDTNIH